MFPKNVKCNEVTHLPLLRDELGNLGLSFDIPNEMYNSSLIHKYIPPSHEHKHAKFYRKIARSTRVTRVSVSDT